MKNNILELRKSIGMTQDELAAKSGVSRTTISKLENQEDVIVKSNTLLALSKALNKPLTEIFFV